MKLYNANLSPFASRSRIQIYAKGLDIELVSPPSALGSDEYKSINPTGKVPALEVDGVVIPESQAIAEFLEDRFPEPPLRPRDDVERAQMRALCEITDLYIVPPLLRLFGQFPPNERDDEAVKDATDLLTGWLDPLEKLFADGPYAAGAELTLADCALHPMFFFVVRVIPALGGPNPLEGRPKLAAWWDHVRKHEAVAQVAEELRQALAAR